MKERLITYKFLENKRYHIVISEENPEISCAMSHDNLLMFKIVSFGKDNGTHAFQVLALQVPGFPFSLVSYESEFELLEEVLTATFEWGEKQ